MKIIQNTLKIEEKFSDIPEKFRVGPKKVGLVGFPETRHYFSSFWPNGKICFLTASFLPAERYLNTVFLLHIYTPI